jgi:hypothetical protein
MSDDEKKIIIDEDWKEQVQADREAADQPNDSDTDQPDVQRPPSGGPLPPADLSTIVSMLATQAMLSMGAIPNPISGKQEVHPDQARHFVDLLEVLQEKTKGNCTPDESKMMDGLLHELRMGFLAVQNAPPPQDAAESTSQ